MSGVLRGEGGQSLVRETRGGKPKLELERAVGGGICLLPLTAPGGGGGGGGAKAYIHEITDHEQELEATVGHDHWQKEQEGECHENSFPE